MAQALALKHFGDRVLIESAGSKPTQVNPFAVAAMAELGVDISEWESKHVDTIDHESVDLVIMLCAEEECPAFLGSAMVLDWSMPDPDKKNKKLKDATRLKHFITARDAIQAKIEGLYELN